MTMRALIAALMLGLSFLPGCETADRPSDVFDGGEPLYIAQASK